MANRNYIKRKSYELYTRAMKRSDSKTTVIEHMSSLIAYCEAHTEYRGDNPLCFTVKFFTEIFDAFRERKFISALFNEIHCFRHVYIFRHDKNQLRYNSIVAGLLITFQIVNSFINKIISQK